MNPRRPTLGELIFDLVVLCLALVIHGPAGAFLASAQGSNGNIILALLVGFFWLTSGAVILAAILFAVWTMRAFWRSHRS